MLTLYVLAEAGLPPAVSWILAILAIVGTITAAYLIVVSKRTQLVIQQQSTTIESLTSTVTSQEAENRMHKDQIDNLRQRGNDQAETITHQNSQIEYWKDVVTQKEAIAQLSKDTATFHAAILQALNDARSQTAASQAAILTAVTELTREVTNLKRTPPQSEIGTGRQ